MWEFSASSTLVANCRPDRWYLFFIIWCHKPYSTMLMTKTKEYPALLKCRATLSKSNHLATSSMLDTRLSTERERERSSAQRQQFRRGERKRVEHSTAQHSTKESIWSHLVTAGAGAGQDGTQQRQEGLAHEDLANF